MLMPIALYRCCSWLRVPVLRLSGASFAGMLLWRQILPVSVGVAWLRLR